MIWRRLEIMKVNKDSCRFCNFIFISLLWNVGENRLKIYQVWGVNLPRNELILLLWFKYSASLRRSLAWNCKFKDSIWNEFVKSACWELSASAKIVVLYYSFPLDRFQSPNCNVQRNVFILKRRTTVEAFMNLCCCISAHMFESK